jgi:ABC-2 type transport system permease protein
MRAALVIASRDVRAAFESPLAYVLIAAFATMSGLFFAHFLFSYSDLSDALRMEALKDPSLLSRFTLERAVVSPALRVQTALVGVLAPLLTMRALAEEKRQGTMELLLTAPITHVSLTLGKWLGALAVACIAIALTIGQPLALIALAAPDAGPILTGYAGLFLVAASFTALGLLASSLTESPVVAAFLGFAFVAASMACGVFGNKMASNAGTAVAWLSPLVHYDGLAEGLVDTSDLAFYLLFPAAVLYLTLRVVDSRRWR